MGLGNGASPIWGFILVSGMCVQAACLWETWERLGLGKCGLRTLSATALRHLVRKGHSDSKEPGREEETCGSVPSQSDMPGTRNFGDQDHCHVSAPHVSFQLYLPSSVCVWTLVTEKALPLRDHSLSILKLGGFDTGFQGSLF